MGSGENGLEFSVILRWDKTILTASEKCVLVHPHLREAEWVTSLHCSSSLIPRCYFSPDNPLSIYPGRPVKM